jgi:hypothetical protein
MSFRINAPSGAKDEEPRTKDQICAAQSLTVTQCCQIS